LSQPIFASLARQRSSLDHDSTEFERGVIRERTLAGLQAARARGRTGGRPPALKPKDLAAARAMLQDPGITVREAARRLGVAASTLYRHLPRARTAALDA
jgi:DNA invertase Pin-like site-specific DNA recombinase